jgi:hypothetical protein
MNVSLPALRAMAPRPIPRSTPTVSSPAIAHTSGVATATVQLQPTLPPPPLAPAALPHRPALTRAPTPSVCPHSFLLIWSFANITLQLRIATTTTIAMTATTRTATMTRLRALLPAPRASRRRPATPAPMSRSVPPLPASSVWLLLHLLCEEIGWVFNLLPCNPTWSYWTVPDLDNGVALSALYHNLAFFRVIVS